jgi:hypothetical protein
MITADVGAILVIARNATQWDTSRAITRIAPTNAMHCIAAIATSVLP